MRSRSKLCYLYTPILQAIETELESKREEYKVKDVLGLIIRGSFYQFLIMKTQPAKFLVNNRSTEVNVKTIVSGITTVVGNKLSIHNLSDVVLYYRLEEALYQTAPHGLPFEFEKIIKAMKKIDRNITADKFAKWEKKMNLIEKQIKFLEPYHFVYLMSLSEPVSKKKQSIFQIDKKENKFQKQSQMMNIMKEKNNFIDFQKRKSNWKNQIKVRGLSFQESSEVEKLNKVKREFSDLRKKIISHKRVKSAYITGRAVQMVKTDLKDRNLTGNSRLLDNFFIKPQTDPPNDRKLLKKHKKLSQAIQQSEQHRRMEHQRFNRVYNKQMLIHKSECCHQQNTQKNQQSRQNSQRSSEINSNDKNGGLQSEDEDAVDIYSHHLMKILANSKCKKPGKYGNKKFNGLKNGENQVPLWL